MAQAAPVSAGECTGKPIAIIIVATYAVYTRALGINDAKKTQKNAKKRKNRQKDGHHGDRLSAVTSISIFIRGSSNPAEIIIAAGRTSPKYRLSTGQQGSKSAALGST